MLCDDSFIRGGVELHLSESSGRRRPALVQDVLGQIPAQRHEEGVAHVIQEILVLRTALLVAVDEAFDEPEDETIKGIPKKAEQNLFLLPLF